MDIESLKEQLKGAELLNSHVYAPCDHCRATGWGQRYRDKTKRVDFCVCDACRLEVEW
jgi:hypothetical protein